MSDIVPCLLGGETEAGDIAPALERVCSGLSRAGVLGLALIGMLYGPDSGERSPHCRAQQEEELRLAISGPHPCSLSFTL